MKKPFFLTALLTAIIMTGCYFLHWHYDTEERSLEGFNGIVYKSVANLNLNIRSGSEHKVVITADVDIIGKITTNVRNNTLYIEADGFPSRFSRSEKNIVIYMPQLESVTHDGVGDIDVSDVSNLRNITHNGVGNITISSNSSNPSPNSESSRIDILHDGVGNVYAHNYRADSVAAHLSGVGDITLWADELLMARLTGVGDIRYRGSPLIVSGTQAMDEDVIAEVPRVVNNWQNPNVAPGVIPPYVGDGTDTSVRDSQQNRGLITIEGDGTIEQWKE